MATLLPAQTAIHQISTGNGYGKSAYYKFTDGASQQIAHDAWDIAFSNLGPQQAGIFVNESTASVNGQPGPAVEAPGRGHEHPHRQQRRNPRHQVEPATAS